MSLLTSRVLPDEITNDLSKAFDYTFDGETTFSVPLLPPLPALWRIGLIVGPSGSGKSQLLKQHFGDASLPTWNPEKAIASHFKSAKDAAEKLNAVGLNSVPSWMRPYHVLSTGEKFRADLARQMRDGAIIDEFTSVVDRRVARSTARALSRYCVEKSLKNIVLATCHYDITEWLQPDWVFNTFTGELTGRGLKRRPQINIEVRPCGVEVWRVFMQHHYLSGSINKSCRCWAATWDGELVGFASALPFPNGNFKNAWREHRTVVLPDYQGLGMGVRLSDAVASMFTSRGFRYFSKTSNPRMGGYRQNSPLWSATSKNGKARKDYSMLRKTKEDGHKMRHAARVCFSHEFIGTVK